MFLGTGALGPAHALAMGCQCRVVHNHSEDLVPFLPGRWNGKQKGWNFGDRTWVTIFTY